MMATDATEQAFTGQGIDAILANTTDIFHVDGFMKYSTIQDTYQGGILGLFLGKLCTN